MSGESPPNLAGRGLVSMVLQSAAERGSSRFSAGHPEAEGSTAPRHRQYRPRTSGETYAQIAATQAPVSLEREAVWDEGDVDRRDDLDSLSNFEGIITDHRWSNRRVVRSSGEGSRVDTLTRQINGASGPRSEEGRVVEEGTQPDAQSEEPMMRQFPYMSVAPGSPGSPTPPPESGTIRRIISIPNLPSRSASSDRDAIASDVWRIWGSNPPSSNRDATPDLSAGPSQNQLSLRRMWPNRRSRTESTANPDTSSDLPAMDPGRAEDNIWASGIPLGPDAPAERSTSSPEPINDRPSSPPGYVSWRDMYAHPNLPLTTDNGTGLLEGGRWSYVGPLGRIPADEVPERERLERLDDLLHLSSPSPDLSSSSMPTRTRILPNPTTAPSRITSRPTSGAISQPRSRVFSSTSGAPITHLSFGADGIIQTREDTAGIASTPMLESSGSWTSLRRGGNNRRRISAYQSLENEMQGLSPMSRRILNEVRAMDSRTAEAIIGTQVAAPMATPRRAGLHPTNGGASAATPLLVRTGGTRRAREVSPEEIESTAKRRRTNHKETKEAEQSSTSSLRPSYLDYSSLSPSTPLPHAFNPPQRLSHLALTAHHSSSQSPNQPPRPLITFTNHPLPTRTDADASALRTTTPIPVGCGIHYYEIEVIDSGPEGYMSLGWMVADGSLGRLVGWDKGSWGWHGDDGRVFEGRGSGETFGPLWGVGDIIGAGIDYSTNKAFFTKNGKLIGHAFKNMPPDLHPAIGLRNPKESISVNLLGPFMYDIDRHVRDVKDGVLRDIRQTHVIKVPRLVEQIIEDPLLGARAARTAPLSSSGTQTLFIETGPTGSDNARQRSSGSTTPKQADFAVEIPKASSAAQCQVAVDEKHVNHQFQDAESITTAAFVLDYISHLGLDKVSRSMQRDLLRRKIIPLGHDPDTLELASVTARMRGIELAISIGKRVPWTDIGGLSDSGAGSENQLKADHLDLPESLRRRLRILDLAALLFPPEPSASTQRNGDDGETESTDMPTTHSDEVVAETGTGEMSELLGLAEGKLLMAASKEENWTSQERTLLSEAIGLIATTDMEKSRVIWNERRGAWAAELTASLRAALKMKPRSHLEQAIAQTRILLRSLIQKGDGAGAFMDVPQYLAEYGKPSSAT